MLALTNYLRAKANAQSQPNITIMLADDLGFASISTFGGPAETPNLTDLANNGAKFTNYYVQPRCSPTRAALMTGHQNQKVGFSVLSGDSVRLNQNHVFLPELLRDNGYSTYLFGKWHLGSTDNFGTLGPIPETATLDPRVHGFDHAFTFNNGSANNARNWQTGQYRLLTDVQTLTPPGDRYATDNNGGYNRYDASGVFTDSAGGTPEFYQTDAIIDYSLDFLQHHRDKNAANGTSNPFFQYIAFGAPHFWNEAPLEVVNKYSAVNPNGTVTAGTHADFSTGWDAVRTDRLQSMIAEDVVPSDLVMSPPDDAYQSPNNDGAKPQLLPGAFQTNVNSSLPNSNSDFNFDGVQDTLDPQWFIDNWLRDHGVGSTDSYMLGDRDFNGINDLGDCVLMRQDFIDAGQGQMLTSFTQRVSEPAAMVLSLLALPILAVLLWTRRRMIAPALASLLERVETRDRARGLSGCLFATCLALIATSYATCGTSLAQSDPNILIILTDDLGYSDLGSYGGEINTPNLDALASEGVRFKNFNVAPRCSPTRAALMTGHQNHKLGFNVLIGDNGRLNQNHVFLPELLQANGYHTYMSGKWHLGGTTNFGSNGPIPGNDNTDPRVRGFDHVFTFDNSSHSENNWNPNAYRLLSSSSAGNPAIAARTYQTHPGSTQYIQGTTFYQTDAIGDYTLDFLQHHRDRNTANGTDNPFFGYMAFGAPHFPIEAPKSLVDQYVSQYQAGWDAVRADRLQNMIDIGIIDSGLTLPERSDVPPTNQSGEAVHQIRSWDSLAADRQADLVRRMASYAAMVDIVDQNIGRVVDDLEVNGELENTIVMFLSDNGGDAEWHEYGFSVNESIRTGQDLLEMGTNADTGPTVFYGTGWANVSNTPYINYKHYTHEGGVNSPFIVRWGDGLDQNLVGEIVDDTLTVNDIMPTLLSILDMQLPANWTAQNGAEYDVEPFHPTLVSFDQLLAEGTPVGPRDYGIEHESNRAFQSGDWKLVSSNFASPTWGTAANEWELYNLADDPLEQNNLAHDAQHEAIFNDLRLKYDVWAFQTNVSNTLPVENSDFNFDGRHDELDIRLFVDNWLKRHQGGGTIDSYMLGDRNIDGVNDLADWVLIRRDFLATGRGALLDRLTLGVPEPPSLLPFAICLLAFGTKYLMSRGYLFQPSVARRS